MRRCPLYNFWQFIHVLSAVVWVGSAALSVFLSVRLAGMNDNPIAGPASGLMEKTSVPIFIVSSLATLISGLILAIGWIGFEPLWIKIGLAGVIISIIVGIAYFRPYGEKLEAAIQTSGPDDPKVRAMVQQAQIVSIAELVLLAFVIWAMVVKPA